MPRCKNCKEKFIAINFNQKYCFTPACVGVWLNVESEKRWTKKRVELKESLKTKSDHLKETQILFNKYIRERDKNQLCISCGQIPKKRNAGHYFSQGGHSAVRFDEDNVHLQCEHCNSYLSGNLLNYQIGIQQRIGADKLLELQGRANDIKKWEVQELKELQKIIKKKIKELLHTK